MLKFRFANIEDISLYYKWANEPVSRENSYNKGEIDFVNHVNWFTSKLNSKDCFFYLFFNEEEKPVGQVRIEKKEELLKQAVISLSVETNCRGKGYGSEMIKLATDDFLDKFKGFLIIACVFKSNIASYNSFIKAGYMLEYEKVINDIPSYIFLKK